MTKTAAVTLLLLLAGSRFSHASAKDWDATAEFKPIIERLNAAWSTLDTSKAAPFYAKDAGLVFYDIAPLKYSGWPEYESGFKKVSADWKSLKITVNPDLRAMRRGSLAWATYTFDFEIEPKQGNVIKATARVTDLFEKRGSQWVIIHEHVSTPMP